MLALAAIGPWWTALLSLLAVALPAALMGWCRRGSRLGAGTHVFITGGSKGLGLELAKLCASRGCSVTIVARSQGDLDLALQQVQAAADVAAAAAAAAGKRGGTSSRGGAIPGANAAPKCQALSGNTVDPAKMKEVVRQAESVAGPVDLLICNAGVSEPGLFVEQAPQVFERQMSVNYLGSVHSIQAVLPGMLERRGGRVVIVTSALAVLGFAGYASYAPTKWALRGLADCLRNELLGTGVEVSVAYPPDMDTPGYAAEMQGKPAVCTAVNSALGSELFTAQQVARAMLRGVERGDFHLPSPDLGQNFLVAGMTGLSPKRFFLPVHVLIGPILPLVTSAFGWLADRAARKYNAAHDMLGRGGSSGGTK